MKIKIKSQYDYSLFIWLFAFEGILSTNPFLIWPGYTYNGYFNILKQVLEIFLIFIFILFKRYQRGIDRQNIAFLISFTIVYVYYNLNCFPGTFKLTVGLFSKYAIIAVFLLLPNIYKKKIFKAFSILFALSLIPGIVFIILNLIGLPLSHGVIESSQAIKANSVYKYTHYLGCVFLENIYDIRTFKALCGIYDEHGMVGTISALILVAEKFKFNQNKWYLKIILLGGILSMSLAFFLIAIMYWGYSLCKARRKRALLATLAVFLLVIIVLILFRNNYYIQKFIINRLNISYLLNNNRAELQFQIVFADFIKSSKLWFGNGINNPLFDTVDAASAQVMIYNIGIIGTLFYIGWYIYWGVKKSKKNINCLVLVGIFFLSFLQRPWIIYLYFMILLFGGIQEIKSGENFV